MTEGWAAVGVAVAAASAAAGIGLSVADQPTYGTPTNPAASSKAISDAQAALLPIQRGMAAAAQEGGKFTFSLPPGVDPSAFGFPTGNQPAAPEAPVTAPPVVTTKRGLNGQPITTTRPGQQQGTARNGTPLQSPLRNAPAAAVAAPQNQIPGLTRNADGSYTVDFAGRGAAQTQGTIAKQQSADQLALAQKYDPQFIAEALKEEQQADPQGTEARALEASLIQKQAGENFINPVSETLSRQIDQQVNAGKGLDPMEQEALNSSVGDAMAARGGGNAQGTDFAAPLTTGAAGIQRQAAGQQKAIGELSSGTTPEDVQYREQQQTMADLSALMSGQTPTSEFRSLSGAQNGPTPTVAGQPLPTSAGGTVQAGQQSVLSQNATGNQVRAATANPWLAGLSTTINSVGALGNAGFFGG